MNINLFQLLLCICYVGLSVVSCNRKVTLNRDSNGACINVPSVGVDTSFELNFDQAKANWELFEFMDYSIPVIVFNYLDLEHIKGLPDADEFFKMKYFESLLSVKDEKRFLYDINLKYEEEKLVHPILEKMVNITEGQASICYPITVPGIYCIYVPKVFVTVNEQRDTGTDIGSGKMVGSMGADEFPRPFQLTVEVNEERYMLREKCAIQIIPIFQLLIVLFLFFIVYNNVISVQPLNSHERKNNIVFELMKATRDSKNIPIIVKHLIYLISLIVVIDAIFLGLLISSTIFAEIVPIGITKFIISGFRGITSTFFGSLLFWFMYLIQLGHGTVYDFSISDISNQYKPPNKLLKFSSLVLVLIMSIGPDGLFQEWTTYFDGSIILNRKYYENYPTIKFIDLIYRLVASIALIFIWFYGIRYYIEAYKKLKNVAIMSSTKNESKTVRHYLIYSVYYNFGNLFVRILWSLVVYFYFGFPNDFTKYVGTEITYKVGICFNYGCLISDIFFIWLIWGMKPTGLREIDISESNAETISGKAIMLE